MLTLPLSTISMLLLSAVAQIVGIFLLPLTRGFTNPLPTIGASLAMLLGFGLMARIAHSGVNLSFIVPILAATVPLGSILISILVYGEAASLTKISVLTVSCILIGLANAI